MIFRSSASQANPEESPSLADEIQRPDASSWGDVQTHVRRVAWAGWLVIVLVASVLALSGTRRTVVPEYRGAAVAWVHGKPLYSQDGSGYLYLPQSAILHVPLAMLPERLHEFLWRLIGLGLLAAGVRQFLKMGTRRESAFEWASLIIIPLAWDSSRNGQATLHLTGLILIAIASCANGRHTLSAVALSLAIAVKPLAIVPVLLLMALDPRMRWRLALGVLFCLVTPFLFQQPSYAFNQYAECLHSLRVTAHVGVVRLWAQPFSALKLTGIEISESTQTLIRAGAAVLTLLLCWLAQRRLDTARFSFFLFAFTSAYLMLFNPRTENNSYVMLAPAIATFFAEATARKERIGETILLAAMAVGITGGYQIGRSLFRDVTPIWLAPAVTVAFTVYLLDRFRRELRLATGNPATAAGCECA